MSNPSDERPTQAGHPWGAPPPWQQPPCPPPPGPPPGYPPGPPPGPPPGYGYGPPPGPPGPQRRSRLPLVLGVVAAVLVLGVAVTVPIVLSGDDDEPTSQGTDDPSGDSSSETDDVSADLSEVRVYDDLEPSHSEEPITYEQSPPVGGEHYPRWIECGVYDEPLPNELAVHDLEHGTFWFTYDAAALSAEEVDALAAQLPENGIMSPYEGLSAPVVVTVWGRQLDLTGADDPRLPLFLDEFAGGDTSPEPFASCAGGVSPDEAAGLVGA